jgi:hypothetical protein
MDGLLRAAGASSRTTLRVAASGGRRSRSMTKLARWRAKSLHALNGVFRLCAAKVYKCSEGSLYSCRKDRVRQPGKCFRAAK